MNNNKPNLTLTINTTPLLASIREMIEELEDNQPKATLTVPTHLLQTLHQELATTTAVWMDMCSRVEYKGKIIKDRGSVSEETTTIYFIPSKGQERKLNMKL